MGTDHHAPAGVRQQVGRLIAGGNLPDLFYLNPGQNATAQFKAMDQGAFTDLTPFVTGDALKAYKNLATFPDYMWNNVKFKNKIIGVPKPLQRNGNIGFYRGDWAKKLGKAAPTSMPELHDFLVAFAKGDPDGNGQADTWGLGRYGTMWEGWDDARVALNMFGTPFTWRKNADGTLTTRSRPTNSARGSISCARCTPTARSIPMPQA